MNSLLIGLHKNKITVHLAGCTGIGNEREGEPESNLHLISFTKFIAENRNGNPVGWW